jgi:hypothetical protein
MCLSTLQHKQPRFELVPYVPENPLSVNYIYLSTSTREIFTDDWGYKIEEKLHLGVREQKIDEEELQKSEYHYTRLLGKL